MQQRLDPAKISPGGYQAYGGFQAASMKTELEHSLIELVKIRASQINGCAFCLNMHVADARKLGEREERMHLLNAWRESPCYSERERAALAWTEAVTLISESHAPDALYEEARRHFSEKELVELTYAIVAINGWNRLAVAFRRTPILDRYEP